MHRIEDLVRDSLRQRAEDVEPTPALWRGVDRRIARRRRFRVTSWAMAAVAAALTAFVVVPGLLGDTDPSGLEIEPMGPATGLVPATAVVAAEGELWLLDLATGERTSLERNNPEPVEQIAVAPGSTLDDYRIAVVQTNPQGGAQLTFDYGPDAGGVTGILEAHAVEHDFVPTITWSPDGEFVAYTVPGDDDEANVVIEAAPAGFDGFLEPREAAGVGAIGEHDVLLDWVGPVAAAGDVSELWVRRNDDTVAILEVEALGHSDAFVPLSDGLPTVRGGWGGNPDVFVTDVAAAVAADPNGEVAGLRTYLLAPGRQTGPSLFWAAGVGVVGGDRPPVELPPAEVPLGGVVGDADLDALWLDAAQDAALIGDGERTWLFTHDGSGGFRPPVELAADITAAALFDAPRPGAADEPTDGRAAGPTVAARLDELALIGPDGARSLVTLDDAGESRFVSARVARAPRSTASPWWH